MSLSEAYKFISDRIESHLYGFSSSHVIKDLPKTILGLERESGIILVSFRSKADVNEAYQGKEKDAHIGIIAGQVSNLDLNLNRIIYGTTSKIRNLLIKLNSQNNLKKISWLCISSWDSYDPNAYALYGLWKRFKMEDHCPIVYLSVSPFCNLPSDTYELFQVTNNKIKIEYVKDSPLFLAQKANKKTLLFGPYNKIANNKVIIKNNLERIDSNAEVIIDSLLDSNGKRITKHLSYLRADMIDAGIVYRCMDQRDYNKLKPNFIPLNKGRLKEVALYLLSEKIDPMTIFPNNHYKDIRKIKDIVQNKKLKTTHLKFIVHSGLEIYPSLFLNDWFFYVGKTDYFLYTGCVIACLINNLPSLYAPLDSYRKFMDKILSRNDLETLCKMWNDLMSLSNMPVYKLNLDNNRKLVINWCKQNDFYIDGILQLCELFDKIYQRYVTEETGRPPNKTINTSTLNAAIIIIAEIYPRIVDINKWDLTELLPNKISKPEKGSIILQQRKNKLLLYINEKELVDFERIVDDISDFGDF